MITEDWLGKLMVDTTDPRKKSILLVLVDSYNHWETQSRLSHSWPYDEHVKDMLWQCEVALHAFTGL